MISKISEEIYKLGSFFCFDKKNQSTLEKIFEENNVELYEIEYHLYPGEFEKDRIHFYTIYGNYAINRKHFRNCKKDRTKDQLLIFLN